MRRAVFAPLFPLALAFASSLASEAHAGLVYTKIAQDFVGGVGFIDGTVDTAISANGTVIFAASATGGAAGLTQQIFGGTGGALDMINLSSNGYSNVLSIQVGALGDVVFVGTRANNGDTFSGVYHTTLTGGGFSTLYEALNEFDHDPFPRPRVRMAENGTIAFSTITNGEGAIYRASSPGGPIEVLRSGSGTFFNTQQFDVNSSGTVAVQMEYTDPNMGLSRGILNFSTPEQALSEVQTTLERMSVGVQPAVAINDLGQVAFALNTSVTINYFDPPFPGGGAPNGSQMLGPGVYLATPSDFGTPFTFTQIASLADGYASFGDVDVNNSGLVVFEASLAGGDNGIFFGSDPTIDVVARTGVDTTINGEDHFFSIVRLGQLNDAGQLSFQTSDFETTDQIVWRVTIPTPGALAMLMLAGTARRRRR